MTAPESTPVEHIAASEELRAHLSALEEAAGVVLHLSPERRITGFNAAAETLYGRARAELLGADFLEALVPEGDRAAVAAHIRAVLSGSRSLDFEGLVPAADGELRLLTWKLSAVAGPGGPRSITLVGRDVTERWRTEEALLASERSYRQVFNATNEAIFIHDAATGQVLDVNQAMLDMFGCTREQALSMSVEDISLGEPPYSMAEAAEKIRLAVEQGPQYFVWRSRRLNGDLFWSEASLASTEIGGKGRVLAVVRDVTARRHTERELRETRALLLAAIEQTPAGILIADAPDVRIRLANSAALGIRGATSEPLTDIPAERHPENWQTFHPDGAPFTPEELPLSRAILDGATSKNVEVIIRRPDGEARWVLANAAPVRDEEGEIVAGVVVFPDITERKRSDEETRRLATAVEQSAEIIFITDAEGEIQYVNPAFEVTTGYSREEAIGNHPRILRSGEHDDAFYDEVNATIARGEVWRGRVISKRKDGGHFEEEVTISPIRDAAGRVVNFVNVARNVTHEAELERQLRQAQKMEAIGTLAGGIAHDFNNILVPIIGYTEMSLYELPGESPVRQNLQEVLRAANRAQELVKQILTFSREREQKRQPVRLSSVVVEVQNLLRATLPATIRIDTELGARSDIVLADPTQLHQIVINLCTNAAHAMGESGGVLTLTLSRFRPTPGSPAPCKRHGPHVRLSVRDTGGGIPAAIAHRIFEPYFTTKGQAGGTGLGLAVVHGIVEALGGAIAVESWPGSGTVFDVYIPEVERTEAPPEHPLAELPAGTGRILLVDDEVAATALFERALVKLGYQVRSFNGAPEARDAFLAAPDEFDLAITDMTMPAMTGLDLAAVLKAARPDLPVLICSGHNDLISAERLRDLGFQGLLTKPISLGELAEAVRQTLADAG